MDHIWAVMGFGGNGITYSVIASQVVAAEIRGERDTDADLYRASTPGQSRPVLPGAQ
jgi:glycine/D-amino acid oxidase-like deaminating enzyme